MIDESVPPFYVILKIHDYLVYNFMLDYGVSHNIIPKLIMDQIQLQITRPYRDLYMFGSKKVHFLRLIKDLVVTLA